MTQDKLTLLSGYKYMKLGGKKHPDHIEDSYERLSVNLMAAGSRLYIKYDHEFFLIPVSFSNMLFSQHL